LILTSVIFSLAALLLKLLAIELIDDCGMTFVK